MSTSRRRSLPVLCAVALAACAHRAPADAAARPASLARAAPRATVPPTPTARAEFDPPRGDAIFANAVQVLAQSGYTLTACDANLGALSTEKREVDVPCRGGTCLARQRISLKLGWRVAKMVVAREVWDWSLKEWAPLADNALEQSLAVDESALLSRILAVPPAPAEAPREDPCRPVAIPGPCGEGGCVGRAPNDPG